MKKFALLAAVAALTAACSQEAEEAPVVEETTAAAPADTMAAETVTPGTYDVAMADGTTMTSTINPDGTYVDTMADGTEVRGTVVRRNGQDCFDPEGDDPEECFTAGTPGADGSFTATGPDGTTVTVRPRAAATPTAGATTAAPTT